MAIITGGASRSHREPAQATALERARGHPGALRSHSHGYSVKGPRGTPIPFVLIPGEGGAEA